MLIYIITFFGAILEFVKKRKRINNEQNDDSEKKKAKRLAVFLLIAELIFSLLFSLFTYVADYQAHNVISYKPIIYLYPEEDTEVSVIMGYSDKLTTTYPKYVDGWNVLAHPNGELKDLDTDKDLYALYYESLDLVKFKVEKDGFVVKGEDVAEFLEEKLEILGLNYKEKEEFIVYWLPKLEANKYNYIRFATTEEINKNMPLK